MVIIMNIDDVVSEKVGANQGDKFDLLFKMQKQLMDKYKVPYPVSIHTKEGQKLLREMAGYVTEEIYEAMNILKNRPWTNYQIPVDESHYREELSDILHFVIELYIMSGEDANSIFDLYSRKHRVNKFRIDSKY